MIARNLATATARQARHSPWPDDVAAAVAAGRWGDPV